MSGNFTLSGSRNIVTSAELEASKGADEDSDFEIVTPVKRQRSSDSPAEEDPEKRGKWASVISVD
jgi:hypothetical protein